MRVSGERGVASTIGYMIIISIVLLSATSMFIVGSMTVSDAQSLAERESARQTMTVFNSEASMVAFEGSGTQVVQYPSNSDLSTQEQGQLTLTLVNDSGDGVTEQVLYDRPLESFVYTKPGYVVSYQGGGVWAMRNGDPNTSAIVSPPEFSYTDNTATLPIVGVNAESGVSSTGDVRISKAGKTEGVFPAGASDEMSNPVEPEQDLVLEVQSPFYQAWGRYFDERIGLNPNYDHANNTVTVYLVGEIEKSGVMSKGVTSSAADDRIQIKGSGAGNTFIDSYDSDVGDYSESQSENGTISAKTGINAGGQVAFYGDVETEGDLILKGGSCVHGDATVSGSLQVKGGGSDCIDGNVSSDASVPSAPIADPIIDSMHDKVSASNNNNDTTAIEDGPSGPVGELDTDADPTLESGQYYIDELDVESGETVTLDISSGDVVIVSDGPISVDGKIRVIGNDGNSNRAAVLTRSQSLTSSGGNVSVEGDQADAMWFYAPSGTTMDLDSAKVTGVLYAAGTSTSPGSVSLSSHTSLYGSVVGGETEILSQSRVHQDMALRETSVFKDMNTDQIVLTEVQYFHISHTTLNVTSG